MSFSYVTTPLTENSAFCWILLSSWLLALSPGDTNRSVDWNIFVLNTRWWTQ